MSTSIPKVCLNMIVKNESRIIIRLLESVLPYIDTYCICDTGSTDNTRELITTFFLGKSIPGKIVVEPFKDFGYNRTFALKACDDVPADYALLLDADMQFWVNPKISPTQFRQSLTADLYYIFQGSETFFYKNARIVKVRRGFEYWGVTHEYVKTPNNCIDGSFDKSDVFINDIGDGGCKSDKVSRDILLLTNGLIEHPDNDRYTFYLANTYRDSQQFDKAIEMYHKRIKLGGWFEEVWYSYYSIGKCYKSKGDIANAIYYWMEAYQYFPNRIENLYEIIQHYRYESKHNLAYPFYVIAHNERKKHPKWDYLFLQKDIYDFKLDFELTIIGYYNNSANFNLPYYSMKILADPNVDDGICRNILSNYKFYTSELVSRGFTQFEKNKNLLKTIGENLSISKDSDFVQSTPSMVIHNGELVINQRYVNYRIDNNGGYVNKDQIKTVNVISRFDIETDHYEWTKIDEYALCYNTKHDSLYVGIEDIRLHSNNTDLMYNGNRGLGQSNIVVEHGKINLSTFYTENSQLLTKENGQGSIEKNWVLFEHENTTKCVYGWYPLVIGNIENSLFKKTDEFKTPTFFKNLRGSTNGVVIDDEIWFICHIVSYEDRRYYYHVMVVLDSATMKLKKYSPLFTFEKAKVEYTLGFVYTPVNNQMIIGYSVMDCETKYISLNKSHFDNMFLNLNV